MGKKIIEIIKDFFQVGITAIIVVFICFKFLFISAQVHGTSMYPTLQTNDRGFSFVLTKNLGIERFDICVIDSSKASELLVKRVIGLPNDTIAYINNMLFINGEYVEEEFLSDDVYTNDFEITLGENEYFCLGDNRPVSKDSRYYGAFSKEEIKSTHFFVYYPFNRIGVK